MGAERFTKKPVTIEAMQVPTHELGNLSELGDLQEWLQSHGVDYEIGQHGVSIVTLEGTMLARPGSWVIRGIEGEFYPCAPEIFDGSYERAGTGASYGELKVALGDACDVAVWLTGLAPIDSPAWPEMNEKLSKALSVAGYGIIESDGEVVGHTLKPVS